MTPRQRLRLHKWLIGASILLGIGLWILVLGNDRCPLTPEGDRWVQDCARFSSVYTCQERAKRLKMCAP